MALSKDLGPRGGLALLVALALGSACSGETSTVAKPNGGGCPSGLLDCEGSCVDTALDPSSCGACGNACAEGETCSAGLCGLDCFGGTTKCGEKCVDTAFDPDNCGGCESACAGGEVCSLGSCGLDCTGGTENCGGLCVDTQVHSSHCGGCDKPCAPDELCSAGQCGFECFGGTQKCGTACVDVQQNDAHCGSCDAACPSGMQCESGFCVLKCGGGTTECNGVCVDTKVDPQHCGGCGLACPMGQVCNGSVCALGCSGGTTECSGACVDTKVDPQNCGACGTACAQGEVCAAGVCDLQCSGGTTKCGQACVDTKIDPQNCGACAKTCGPSESCVKGACVEDKQPPIDNSLKGYWPFDNGPGDLSGNGNSGAVFNATAVAGKVGGAYQVGKGSCIVVPDSASLDMVGGKELTMMAWVDYAGGCAPADRGIVLNKENTYEFGVNCGDTTFQEAIQLSDNNWFWSGTKAVTLNTWHHLAVTWDGTTVRQYLDAAEVDTRALSGQFADRSTGLGIGCRSVPANGGTSGVGSYFVGVIDEVAIYGRALAAGEIQGYYAKTK